MEKQNARQRTIPPKELFFLIDNPIQTVSIILINGDEKRYQGRWVANERGDSVYDYGPNGSKTVQTPLNFISWRCCNEWKRTENRINKSTEVISNPCYSDLLTSATSIIIWEIFSCPQCACEQPHTSVNCELQRWAPPIPIIISANKMNLNRW